MPFTQHPPSDVHAVSPTPPRPAASPGHTEVCWPLGLPLLPTDQPHPLSLPTLSLPSTHHTHGSAYNHRSLAVTHTWGLLCMDTSPVQQSTLHTPPPPQTSVHLARPCASSHRHTQQTGTDSPCGQLAGLGMALDRHSGATHSPGPPGGPQRASGGGNGRRRERMREEDAEEPLGEGETGGRRGMQGGGKERGCLGRRRGKAAGVGQKEANRCNPSSPQWGPGSRHPLRG